MARKTFVDGQEPTIDADELNDLLVFYDDTLSAPTSAQAVANALPVATGSNQGVMSTTQAAKLAAIETAATADQTGAEIVSAINTQLGGSTWQSGGSGSVSWGTIIGTLSAQTDLQSAINAKLTTAVTTTAGFGFVVDEDDMTSNSATKVPTQQSVKAYVDASAVGNTYIVAVDVSSGATLVSGYTSILTTATDTQTAALASATGDAQWHKIHNSVAYAQTVAPTDGGDAIDHIPGESSVAAITLDPGATIELARPAGSTTWYVISYSPPVDPITRALVTYTTAPEFSEGTLSASPWAPALSDGLVQTATSGIDFTLGLPTGDIPAGTRPRAEFYITATANILISLNASYVIDGDNLPLYVANGDVALIQVEYDGTNWHAIGPLSPPVTTIVNSDVDLEPWSQTVYLTGTGVADLPDTRDLKKTTTILIIRNGASGDRQMTKQYASDSFVGSDTLLSAAGMIAFTAEPSASGGNWHSTVD